ncbi:MAG: hypothetical protein Q8835_03600, partial [Sweet potato little leaf phytoplasma]|nr:hypothetical protein [Sweet potato little leaf phytoplasma]
RYFKILKTSGVYWQGNSKNKVLTRIYGVSKGWFLFSDGRLGPNECYKDYQMNCISGLIFD